ncbi:MAG: cadherin domain-containing protein [Dolichospermum sp. WA123]|nr:cadherin domain-containing protein [Dolichospermum sp. WA123]
MTSTLANGLIADELYLNPALEQVRLYLKDFANNQQFTANMRLAFGDTFDTEAALSLGNAWKNQDFSIIPAIALLSSAELNGANGAFAATTNTIYLSQEFVVNHQENVTSITNVILEELGHWIDSQINTTDSVGDEGAIFAALVQRESLSNEDLQLLRAEDDHAVIILNGQSIAIEQQNFTGTAGNDTITGTIGNDVISGLDGNDTLNGGSGNDDLYGGNGNDAVNGDAGDDTLYSDAGSDTLNGDTGYDYYVGDYSNRVTGLNMTYDPTTGNGTITVGTEVDTLISIDSFRVYGGFKGTAFNDVIVGTSANEDWWGLYGGDGNDNISGGAGNDNLFGEEGNDTLNGGSGNDDLYGGNGNDVVNGDAGDDQLYSDAGSDTLNGDTGYDYYVGDYSNRVTGLNMTYDPTTGNGTITVGTEVDTLTSIDSFRVYGGFKGTAFNDVIVGTSANEDWWGLYGGDGNDNISGGAGNDNLFGEEGNDTLNGGSGNDDLYGGNGNDVVNGDAGDDQLYSDAGSDTLNGDTGYDYYVGDYSNRVTGLNMTYDPTTGNGTITVGTEVDTLTSIDSFRVYGGFKGTAFNDVIVGTSANEDWWGLYGGDGNDNISGGAGNDKVFGEEGNDTLNGGSGNDDLYGGNGNDVVNGDAGDDQLYSDAGSDTLNGDTGYDYYVGDYSNRVTGLNMTYDPTTGNGTITVGTEVDTLTSIDSFRVYGGFKGTAFNDVIVGTSANEDWWGLYGGDGNDNISGGAGNDNLFGEEGNDTLNGGSGNDDLYGGNGNDVVNGDAGDDQLYSDAGSDTLNGDTGYDYYVGDYSNRVTGLNMTYDPTTGNGTITVGTEVDTLTSIDSFRVYGGFKGTAFNDVIVGTSANEDWWGLYGGDGNDNISGGAGNDKVFGEEGNDTLIGVNSTSATPGKGEVDVLTGGAGSDRFILGDFNWIGYDDGLSNSAGTNDYAQITDFNTSEGDIIQLKGVSTDYLLAVSGADTQILINKPGTEPDELIGIIKNQTGLSLTANYFAYNQPSISLTVAPSSVLEDGATNLVYTFTRTGDFTNALTVNFGIAGTATLNTDYTQTGAATFNGTTGTITFAANASTATLTIDPTSDNSIEADETIALTLSTGAGYILGTTTAITGTITNDDIANQAPTDITLSKNTIAENSALNSLVGNFSSTDPNALNTFTYSLVAGTGDSDNDLFTIQNNQLQTNAIFDYENNNTYTIRVRTTDQGNLFYEKPLTINITDVNEIPTNITLSNNTINENQSIGTTVGTLNTIDPDQGNTFTYRLINGAGATDNALFTIQNNQLQSNAIFDYETKNTYSIRVRTIDQGRALYDKQLTINIGDLPESYTTIESAGNTKLVTDATNKYFTQIGTNTPTAIKNGGQQIYQDIYGSGWQTIAAETVNGDNQVLWKNVSGNYLHIWSLDSNWNWVSSQGNWGLNSADAFTQETNFAIDANGDGIIGNPYTAIESAGNTKLVKDPTNKYFTQIGTNTPTAIKNGGQQIYQDIYGSGWQTIAAETVNGDNQVLWKNISGNFLHIWHLDNNWNWVSSEGNWGLNSAEALTQETIFGIDANSDGVIGNPSSLTLTGTSANDFLVGGANNDLLTGGGGKDTLTGGLGADKFVYQNFTDSLLANFDVITDFNATTGNDLFRVSTARAGFVNVGAVNTLDAAGIVAKLTAAAFGSNFAAQFSFGQKTFVAINDATAGFNAANDAIIEVTGLTGTLNVNNFVIV